MNATLDDLINDVEKINDSKNVSIPFKLHEFLHELSNNRQLIRFETFLRQYRSDRNKVEL